MLSLERAARIAPEKVLLAANVDRDGGIRREKPVLVILAAGKGTRFGQAPKCAQPVSGIPLARHSIEAFRSYNLGPVICVVGYRHDEVLRALGDDIVYVRSEDPVGGTAYAAFEALSVAGLLGENPLLVITMGDRIVTPSVFRRLCETHRAGQREADLTFLTALYEPPKHRGKGRVVRDENRRVLKIVEERDIDSITDGLRRELLLGITEGNCPLYVVSARTLHGCLAGLTNDNAQHQYYITDMVEAISRSGGDIRTITTSVLDPDYDLLTSDVTRPMDLAILEGILATAVPPSSGIDGGAKTIFRERPAAQVAAIAAQLEEMLSISSGERLGLQADRPVGIGISGGRLRIAFMHPDMGRFFGPAWQMPIGARDASGREQIIVLVQSADDHKIHLFPTTPRFQERLNEVPADSECMYPGDDVSDLYSYESFGTRMAENILLSLGYFSDDELDVRRRKRQPLPPACMWVNSNMRRPFSLVGNAIASMRTLRKGVLGSQVQSVLGRNAFRGLHIVTSGNIPQGGFSSSSAVTVAVKNGINALFDLGIPSDVLVQLACQAEYGTGVRAGSLDQATEQKGKPGVGTLISSNPRDNYRILGTYPVPTGRYRVLFPYSVDRDRVAWQWSWGCYADSPASGRQTTAEMRKMTGKAAELAAILVRLPLETDFFKQIEDELVASGTLGAARRGWVCGILRALPALVSRQELRRQVHENRQWYMSQLIEVCRMDPDSASERADAVLESLFAGWRDPLLRRSTPGGAVLEERGVPLRAMVAYLFAEVAKNFHLIHHPEEWMESVSRSQLGDRCFSLDPGRLPSREEMMREIPWEKPYSGPPLMEKWLERFDARPFDYNEDLDDGHLSSEPPPHLHLMKGTNFFRGLALIDLAEAMLKRAFGHDATAVRINAAGQGDFFQVHVDTRKVAVEDVEAFLRSAFYRRFGLSPDPDFVETHPGGCAVGVRLERFDQLPELIRKLKEGASKVPSSQLIA